MKFSAIQPQPEKTFNSPKVQNCFLSLVTKKRFICPPLSYYVCRHYVTVMYIVNLNAESSIG